MTTYESGLFAEFIARMFLRAHGYRIIRRRHVTGRNTHRAEIDIIARRGDTILFCEVKRRPTMAHAADAIPKTQQSRLRAAAETYLAQIRWRGNARFDVIIVCGIRPHWIRGAF